MSPPPTQVGDVQTKRMQRRNSSASGGGSPGRGRPGGLERQGSNGSMTERTFRRSPSPGRPVSRGQPEVAPPVPQLPRDIPEPPPFRKTASQRRAASLETPTKRVYSPASRTFVQVPTKKPAPPQSASTAAARAGWGVPSTQSPPPQRNDDLYRPDSRNSINFSYPRPSSPPVVPPRSPARAQPPLQTLRNGISPAQAETVKYDVIQAAQQPVKKKKKKVAPRTTEGSHFERGSMEQRPVTTLLEPGPAIVPQTPPDPVKKKKKKQPAVTGETSQFPIDSSPSQESQTSDSAESTPEHIRRNQRASGALNKQPSIVKEDWEGEQEYEQSAAQQREDQGLSPVASPTSVQSKKLTAANMSRKIEEPQPPAQQPTTQVYDAVTVQNSESTTYQAPKDQFLSVEQPQQRTLSISPSRSTRFSDHLSSDLASGKKHDPLPRSVSPVKSALKHYAPDGSVIDPATQQHRDSSITPSDASDSNMSADGSVRRRKSARVSFEPAVEIVGTAAEPLETESPTITSPQNKDSGKRGFFGFGRSKPQLTTIPSEEDVGDHMKPRAQLPSFASVRAKNRRTDSSEYTGIATTQPIQKPAPRDITAPSSSESSSSTTIPSRNQGVSSDQAIGGVLAKEVAGQAARFVPYAPAVGVPKRDSSLPLPPEVTSVEGDGYVSDSESDSSYEEEEEQAVKALNTPTPAASRPMAPPADVERVDKLVGPIVAPAATAAVAAPALRSQAVPALSIHPPTPKIEQANPADQYEVEVPGGFPEATPVPSPALQPQASAAGLGLAQPPVQSSKTGLQDQSPLADNSDDESIDNASIYSDAAEDLDDVDGDGFGSINAIVESRIVSPLPKRQIPDPHDSSPNSPESPLADLHQDIARIASHTSQRRTENQRTTSWDQTQQAWSGIAQQSRQAGVPQQQVPTSSKQTSGGGLEDGKWARVPPQLQPAAEIEKPKKKKKRSAAAAAAVLAPSTSNRQAPALVETPPPPPRTKNQGSSHPTIDNNRTSGSFRQSMRNQPSPQVAAAQGGFRGSMRAQPAPAQPETGLRSSMRAQGPPARQAPPPQAAPAQVSPPRAALQKKHIPPAVTAQPRAAPVSKPAPKLTSNDSDSDSSFQRARRSRPASAGGYSMKRSMRANAGPPPVPPIPAGRGQVRSLSPPQRRPFSPVGEKPFRSSMRASADEPTPTLRNNAAPTLRPQPEHRRSSSMFGRRKAKSPAPGPVLARPQSRGKPSKIQDSDDDEPRPSKFKSRFHDSSDEEDEPTKFRPVRGIPRKADDEDSTDLEDSSDEEEKVPTSRPQPPKIVTSAPAPVAQPTSPTSPTSPSKKKGFFSRLRNKKDKEEPGKPASGSAAAQRDDEEEEVTPDGMMGFSSAAERDEMIRLTMAKLEAAKSGEQEQSATATAPAAQRPGTGQRVMSDSSQRSAQRPGTGSRVMSDISQRSSQRQGMGQRVMSDSWPLPEQTELPDGDRPSTSDGLPKTNGSAIRPGPGSRMASGDIDNTVAYGRSGKKKRFPKLRKAFGLKD